MSLALADIFGRIAQGELIANRALTDLTRAYVTHLGSTLDDIREGGAPPINEIAKLIDQTQNLIYLHTDGPVFRLREVFWKY